MKLALPVSSMFLVTPAGIAGAGQPSPTSGMDCARMMGGGMMSSGPMFAVMTVGWVLGVLVALAAIFALLSLGVFLLRRSRPLGSSAVTHGAHAPS